MNSVGETSNINKMKCSRPHIVSKSLKMMAAWEGGKVGKTNLTKKRNNEGGVGGSAGCAVGVCAQASR